MPCITGPRVLTHAAVVFLAVGFAERAAAQEYHVNVGAANRVSFLSDAPLEDFKGVTNRVDGFVYLEGDGLTGETDLTRSEFYFEVDLASLDTGIGLRNRHMRDNYLETEVFPFATFAGGIEALRRSEDGGFWVEARGTLAIHGVERSRGVECDVEVVEPGATREEPPRRLRIRCEFPVALSDHGIPIPKLMFMKIDEVMELSLDFHMNLSTVRED